MFRVSLWLWGEGRGAFDGCTLVDHVSASDRVGRRVGDQGAPGGLLSGVLQGSLAMSIWTEVIRARVLAAHAAVSGLVVGAVRGEDSSVCASSGKVHSPR